MAELTSIEADKKYIHLNVGSIRYDYLIMASGSKTNFYGNKEIEKNAFGLKSIQDALELRSWIVHCFEKASLFPEDRSWLRFGIAGAGAAGVEMAGALADYTRKLINQDYPDIEASKVEIYLLEGGKAPVSSMSSKAQARISKIIKNMGIHFIPNANVTHYDRTKITYIKNEDVIQIAGRTLIWTAGVNPQRYTGLSDTSFTSSNRLIVDETLKVKGCDSIFAIGDSAFLASSKYPNGLPMVAQVAIQQGIYLAKGLDRTVKMPFKYTDKGSMAIVGMTQAVADVKSLFISGPLGWLLWSFVHLLSLVSFRNRISVAINWMLKYFKYENSHQLITRNVDVTKP